MQTTVLDSPTEQALALYNFGQDILGRVSEDELNEMTLALSSSSDTRPRISSQSYTGLRPALQRDCRARDLIDFNGLCASFGLLVLIFGFIISGQESHYL
ncbi:hypothetical protein V2G26_009553 [Clonostachys chloroleuca]